MGIPAHIDHVLRAKSVRTGWHQRLHHPSSSPSGEGSASRPVSPGDLGSSHRGRILGLSSLNNSFSSELKCPQQDELKILPALLQPVRKAGPSLLSLERIKPSSAGWWAVTPTGSAGTMGSTMPRPSPASPRAAVFGWRSEGPRDREHWASTLVPRPSALPQAVNLPRSSLFTQHLPLTFLHHFPNEDLGNAGHGDDDVLRDRGAGDGLDQLHRRHGQSAWRGTHSNTKHFNPYLAVWACQVSTQVTETCRTAVTEL